MSTLHMTYRAALAAAFAGCLGEAVPPTDPPDPVLTAAPAPQPRLFTQGVRMQGVRMQGVRMQGMTLQGIRLTGATLNNQPWQLQIKSGELIATGPGGAALRGTSLVGLHVLADVHDPSVTPPATDVAEYRIAAIEPEDVTYDPTLTGNTFLYTIEQYVPDSGLWAAACPTDTDGRSAAIALSAVWDDFGARIESSTQFTFGCTIGVLAKCYRWGYRPWITGYGDLAAVHEACTRMARADYCGNGTPQTQDGTPINIWDTLPKPGPILNNQGKVKGMKFEAGWDAGGAVCLRRARWSADRKLARECPDRLIPRGLEATCDSVAEARGFSGNAVLFNETYKNF